MVSPNRFIDDNVFWESFDFQAWSEEDYTYDKDSLRGFFDRAQKPRTTISINSGDCEDYALVAASWAYAQGRNTKLALCFNGKSPVPKHAVAFDGTNVYSSGAVMSYDSIEEYVNDSEYDWFLSRSL